MVDRLIKLSKTRSFFLFGARGTGKSTLLQAHFPESEAIWIDLLDPDLEDRFSRNPELLKKVLSDEEMKPRPRKWVVIDEIQKIPPLLGVVHQAIRSKKFNFALTGSSARKLKRAQADLLAGRASWFELFPLLQVELGTQFDLYQALQFGTLPGIFELEPEEKKRFLRSYCQVYLKEEILSEQLVRKVTPFRNFLECAARQNGQILNYSKFAKDCGVDDNTIVTYFEILVDTLIGFELPPFHLSIRKRQRRNPKFYFFDLGVTRALAGVLEDGLSPGNVAFGRSFEHFVILEILRLARTLEQDFKFSYLTTKDGHEIDLILEQNSKTRIAIEIKSSNQVDPLEVRAFESLAADVPDARLLFLSQDPLPQRIGDVQCLHWQVGIRNLFEKWL